MVLFRGTLPSDHWIVDKHEVFMQGLSLCCAESAFLPAKHLDSVTTLIPLPSSRSALSLPSSNYAAPAQTLKWDDAKNAAWRKRLPEDCAVHQGHGESPWMPQWDTRDIAPHSATELPGQCHCQAGEHQRLPVLYPGWQDLPAALPQHLNLCRNKNQTNCSKDLHKGIILKVLKYHYFRHWPMNQSSKPHTVKYFSPN